MLLISGLDVFFIPVPLRATLGLRGLDLMDFILEAVKRVRPPEKSRGVTGIQRRKDIRQRSLFNDSDYS